MKAQSTQVGFIVILGLVVIIAGLLQVSQVPAEEINTEMEHEKTVKSQFMDISSTLSTPNDLEATDLKYIKMGTKYDQGFIFVTPIPKQHGLRPQGTIRVFDAGNFELTGIDEVYGPKDMKDYYDSRNSVEYQQNSLSYSVNYNRYNDNFIYRYDNSVAYIEDEDSGRNAAISQQNILNGNKISIPLLGGRISDSSINQKKLYVNPVSSGGSSIQVKINDGNLLVPTELSTNEWDYLLDDEDRVSGITNTSNGINIDLENGIYNLQVSKLRLESDSSRDFDEDSNKAYVYHEPLQYSVEDGNRIKIEGTVRDEFNNPISNSNVTINANGETGNGEFLSSGGSQSTTIQTNKNGYFSDNYVTENDNDQIEFTFD